MDPTTASTDPTAMDSSHFLSLPRPDLTQAPLAAGVPDTTTLAAHDFDVDTRTGFMPPEPPVVRLPLEWERWENTLDEAVEKKLQLGRKDGLTEAEAASSRAWRSTVNQVCIHLFPR